MDNWKRITCVLCFVMCAGCANTVPVNNRADLIGYVETGEASYYAMKYQFRKTASGEMFNQLGKTAAHGNLPFGTRVRVTNIQNGKSVVVKINDRGPFVRGRVIDLSRSAFSELARTELGVIDVKVEVIP